MKSVSLQKIVLGDVMTKRISSVLFELLYKRAVECEQTEEYKKEQAEKLNQIHKSDEIKS